MILQVFEQSDKDKSSQATYKCEMCSRAFKEASHFSKHKRGSLCRKSAQKLGKKRKKFLKEKESLEKKTKPLGCPYKPYQCNLCGAKFLDKVNVELHLERTHQTRQALWLQTSRSGGFACSECDLWFADKIQLRQHQHQQQHLSVNTSLSQTSNPHQNDSFTVTPSSFPHQPIVPQQSHQYYLQPLQHIQTFTTNHIHHQLGPPSSPQNIQPQMGPSQGHSLPTFVLPHPSNPSQNSPLSQPTHQNHQQLISNDCLNVQAQVPLSTMNNTPHVNINSPAIVDSSIKLLKMPKFSSCSSNWTGSRRNICCECGHKFVDPINLELHIQRKHPKDRNMYKTNNCTPGNATQVIAPADSPLEEVSSTTKMSNNHTFDCILCGFKAISMGHILKHLQNIHNTNNTNFIYSILTATGTNNEKGTGQKYCKSAGKNMPKFTFEESKFKCDSCSREFDIHADLIKHTLRERNFMCGICNFNSCNETSVSSHVYTFHGESIRDETIIFDRQELSNNYPSQKLVHSQTNINPFLSSNAEARRILHNDSECNLHETTTSMTGNLISSLRQPSKDNEAGTNHPRLLCSVCNFYALSGVALVQHFESHGTVRVTCGKCGESREHFVDLNSHISSKHPGEIIRVSLNMETASADSPISVYMFLITPSLDVTNSCDDDSPNKVKDISKGIILSEKDDDDYSYIGEEPIYACSDCATCLTTNGQLEEHIVLHQIPSKGIIRPSAVSPSSSSNPEQESSSDPNQIVDSLTTQTNPLCHKRGTLEFRCHECGFWRVRSGPVLRHIQAVHMSGGIIHSLRLKSGRIKTMTIHVFTPLSPLVQN